MLDESSMLKAFMGKRKQLMLEMFRNTPMRLCCSATPAPNDHMEIGNHAAFLGVMESHIMLQRFFLNDTGKDSLGKYRLKGHAVEDFWDWVHSWARCAGLPSDLSPTFCDEGYVLPELVVHKEIVSTDITVNTGFDKKRPKQAMLFRVNNLSATSVNKEKRLTISDRATRAAEIVAAEPGEQWIVWVYTNNEADEVKKALKAHNVEHKEVRGSDKLERKEARLEAFTTGEIRVLITKPTIAGLGLNWQHCARMVYVNPTFSFEDYYQSMRRCWRFGQTRPVHVYVIMATTEEGVWNLLMKKQAAHENMKKNMFAATRRAQHKHDIPPEYITGAAELPLWL